MVGNGPPQITKQSEHDSIAQVQILDPQNAVLPKKAHASDAGFDVTAIGIEKEMGPVTLFKTGIAVKPPTGMYFELVPRSSISKTGYMMANSVGIIDPGYRGEILIALRKVNPTAPDLPLPHRIAQLIPRTYPNVCFKTVEALDDTVRGSGGFGSTGPAIPSDPYSLM